MFQVRFHQSENEMRDMLSHPADFELTLPFSQKDDRRCKEGILRTSRGSCEFLVHPSDDLYREGSIIAFMIKGRPSSFFMRRAKLFYMSMLLINLDSHAGAEVKWLAGHNCDDMQPASPWRSWPRRRLLGQGFRR